MGLRFTSGPGECEPYGIPDGWLDDDGFPCALRVALREVEARGGQIVGSEYEWRVVPPEPSMTTLRIRFVTTDPDAGDVALKVAGSSYPILIDVAQAYRTEPNRAPFDLEMAWTDSAVMGVLDGGYHEWVAFNEHGEWVERGWHLDAPICADGNRGFNIDLPSDRKAVVRRERRDFPAWPDPR